MLRAVSLFILILFALPLAAEDASQVFRFGGDVYTSGQSLRIAGETADDVFAAGDKVTTELAVSGTAHLLGRSVSVNGPVGQSVYAAGRAVDIRGAVAGDVYLAGETISVSGGVGGDVRAMAATVTLTGTVGDAVLVGAQEVEFNAAVAGDVRLAADTISFGEAARIEGRLYLYHDDPDGIEVPDWVIGADRIERLKAEEWDGIGATATPARSTWWASLRAFLGGIVVLALAATLVAALAPEFLARIRERALSTPVRSIWMGFLGLSAVTGSTVLFALTGIGLLVAPVALVLAALLGLAGYVIGTYVLGVGIMGLAGQPVPGDLRARALAASAGAVAAGVIGLLPYIGWLFLLGLALFGAGALMVRLFAPGFYTEAA
jgi:cytoskeletal protein CcmA (bactofilin family)